MSNQLDWMQLAARHGYDSPINMVCDLYYIKGMTTREVCDKLIISKHALVQFMEKHRLPRRSLHNDLHCGPRCPDCGSTRSRIRTSWPSRDHSERLRVRQCKECQRYFKTAEVLTGNQATPYP